MAYATLEELAGSLRVVQTATNEPLLQACLDAAAAEIDHSAGRLEDDPIASDDPIANRLNLLRAVEWWKSTDAAFGVIGFNETGALQAPRDGFARHAYALTPLRRSWGVA